jgi:hypothetical protein
MTAAHASTATTTTLIETEKKKQKRKGRDIKDDNDTDDDVIITKVIKAASSADRKDEFKQFRKDEKWSTATLSPCVQIPFEDSNLLDVRKEIGNMVHKTTNIVLVVCNSIIMDYLEPEALIKGLEVMRYRGHGPFQRMWCFFLYLSHYPGKHEDDETEKDEVVVDEHQMIKPRQNHLKVMNVFNYVDELLPQLTSRNGGLLDIGETMQYFLNPTNESNSARERYRNIPCTSFPNAALKESTSKNLLRDGDKVSLALFDALSTMIDEGLSYAAFRLPLVKFICQSGWIGMNRELLSEIHQMSGVEGVDIISPIVTNTFRLADRGACNYLYTHILKIDENRAEETNTLIFKILRDQLTNELPHYLTTSYGHRVQCQLENFREIDDCDRDVGDDFNLLMVDIHEDIQHNKDIVEPMTVAERLAQSGDQSKGIAIRDPTQFKPIRFLCDRCGAWEKIDGRCGDPDCGGCENCCRCNNGDDDDDETCICTEQSQGQCPVHNSDAASCKRCREDPDLTCDCVCRVCKGKPTDPCTCPTHDNDEDL